MNAILTTLGAGHHGALTIIIMKCVANHTMICGLPGKGTGYPAPSPQIRTWRFPVPQFRLFLPSHQPIRRSILVDADHPADKHSSFVPLLYTQLSRFSLNRETRLREKEGTPDAAADAAVDRFIVIYVCRINHGPCVLTNITIHVTEFYLYNSNIDFLNLE